MPSAQDNSSISLSEGIDTQCRFHPTVSEIGRSSWSQCHAGEIEGYDYHVALERSQLEGFSLGAYAVWDGTRLLCAVPQFSTVYDLATTAEGGVRRLLHAVRRYLPGQLELALSCLGSPETEYCQIGFHPSLATGEAELVLDRLLTFWRSDTESKGIGLLGIKDLSDADTVQHRELLTRHGFRAVASLPGSVLPVPYRSIEEYLSCLSAATRKDLRRKLKVRNRVSIEFTREIDSVLPDIMAMYAETRDRSEWQFEELTTDYFRNLFKCGSGTATCSLYRSNGTVVGANVLLEDDNQLLDKFFVMRADMGRPLNLYFLSWIENIQRCIDRRCGVYVAGAAAYETKLRLGCRLDRKWVHFRHSRQEVNLMLRALSPLLGVRQPAPPDAKCWGDGP